MVHALPLDSLPQPQRRTPLQTFDVIDDLNLALQLPDPEDEQLADREFWRQIDVAWQVCDRFDLQTEIWRGRVLRTVRDREKRGGEGRGTGFLQWLQNQEISKSQAYDLIELANSADALLENGVLETEDVNRFSKRAFVETAQAAPEVQQLVCDRLREPAQASDRITRREVRQLQDEWTAMTSELLPAPLKEQAANQTIPTRYLTPLVRELEKLPPSHQASLQTELVNSVDIDTVKQVTAEARYLAKYLAAATQVQRFSEDSVDLESALEEALRIGSLTNTADLINHAAQIEQLMARLYTTWKRLNSLSERVYLDSGSSTPHLRTMLDRLSPLTGEVLEISLGEGKLARTIYFRISTDQIAAD